MNSSRCSETGALLATVLAVAVLLVAAVAPAAAAVSTSADGVPDDAEVGSEVTATFTLSDLYSDYEEWTLNGQTDLTDVTWTVVQYDQAGNQVAKDSYDGESFNASVSIEDDTSEIEVKVTGTVPEVANYTYDPQQSFTVAALNQVRDGGTTDEIDAWSANYHTEESAAAREAIASAQTAIDEAEQAGADTSEAESIVQNAISAYEAENFENAKSLAETSETKANEAAQQKRSSQQTQQLLLYGVGAVVILGLIGGGYYYHQQNQQNTSKLR